jgi:hypothetical protein
MSPPDEELQAEYRLARARLPHHQVSFSGSEPALDQRIEFGDSSGYPFSVHQRKLFDRGYIRADSSADCLSTDNEFARSRLASIRESRRTNRFHLALRMRCRRRAAIILDAGTYGMWDSGQGFIAAPSIGCSSLGVPHWQKSFHAGLRSQICAIRLSQE